MDLYKKSQKFPVQIALYGTCPKIKKSLKNWFRPLGVKRVMNFSGVWRMCWEDSTKGYLYD
jgi:hypothetical protein